MHIALTKVLLFLVLVSGACSSSTYLWGPCFNSGEYRKLSGPLVLSSDIPVWRDVNPSGPLECSWILRPSRGYAATLVVDQFNIVSDAECSDSYLELRKGKKETSPLYGRYCGTDIPRVLTRNGPWFVKLHTTRTDGDGANIFRAIFRLGDCYHYMDGLEGKLESPNFPLPYPSNLYCEWRLEVPAGRRIRLRFTAMDVYSPSDCHLNYYDDGSNMVTTHGGWSQDSPVLARYCGNYAPDIISRENTLMVSFITTDISKRFEATGFQAVFFAFEPSSCDATVFIGMPPALYNSYDKHDTGNVTSVGYPEPYPGDQQCSWTLNARSNKILLTFPHFDIAESDDCSEDYIEVFDGDSDTESNASFGRYCGSSSPPGIVSTGKHLFIKFKSGRNNGRHKGFVAVYNEGPHNYLNAMSGEIVERYTRKANYFIQAPENHRIYMEFPVFSLTLTDIYGKVIIYDGFTGGELIAYFSHVDAHPILSRTNSVRLTYELNVEYELNPEDFKGLHATYTAVETGFKEILEGDSWTVKHINTTEHADHEIYEWVIYPRRKINVNVVLEFHHFDLLDSHDCSEEYVEIRSGPDEDAHLEARLCGNRTPRIFAHEVIYVKFVPRLNGPRGQFIAAYRSACEFNYYWSDHGVITLSPVDMPIYSRGPAFLNEDGHRVHGCMYNVTVPVGYRVALRFDNFSKVESWNSNGYIKVIDGMTEEILGQYGRNIPTVVRASDNKIRVEIFRSVFVAIRYIAEPMEQLFACGVVSSVTYKEEQGNIASPNYPDPYPNNQECVWFLVTDKPDANIVLTFEDFQLERREPIEGKCSKDSIEIRDGHTQDAPLVGIYCSREIPNMIVSTSSSLVVRFRSDDTVQDKGFVMHYAARCYQVYEGPSGMVEVKQRSARSAILTPDCTFEIRGSKTSALSLNFTSLGIKFIVDLKYTYYTKYDSANYVDVLAGEKKEHIIRYYGNSLAPSLTLPYDKVYVNYHLPDNFFGETQAFNITYVEQDIQCKWPTGDLYIEDFGRITNPWGSGGYPADQTCTWRVKSRYRLPVRLTLKNVNLRPNSDVTTSSDDENRRCTDYIQVSTGVDPADTGNKICRMDSQSSFLSHGDTITVTFKTESDDGGNGGFKIEYDEGCGIVDVENGIPPIHNVSNFDVIPGDAPWMAMIHVVNESGVFCSGALVNDLWVLTTVNCLAGRWNKKVMVKLGKTFTNVTEEHQVEFEAVHRECVASFDYSICALKLDRKVYFNSYVRPICLPTFEALKHIRARPGKIGYTFGWGRDYGGAPDNIVLQRIPLESVEWDMCVDSKGDNWYTEREFHCARYMDGNNGGERCYGHSGGPFAKYHKGKWYMVGMVASSRLWDGGEHCPRRGEYGWFWRTVKIDASIKRLVYEN